jgi:UDP-N-acetyl-alpha-D-muramoyl-L-alanyl-L-glutamate epimerase
MSKYQTFVFKRYVFDKPQKTLKLYYSYDNSLEFCETYQFDFDFVDYDEAALDRALQLLFFVAGVSYYKAYVAPDIRVESSEIDSSLAAFLQQTYQKGLGEFFYVNQLDPRTPITFPTNVEDLAPVNIEPRSGQLIGLGGGKDSLVSVDILHDQPNVATWSLNHRSQLEPLVERVDLPHFWVGREWDAQLEGLNKQDALNGHVPISAIIGCVGTIVAILAGYQDVVVSNESSASEPNLHYQGVAINHQYSKSLEFEQSFQSCLENMFGEGIRYYSLLRPFTELHIAELFAQHDFETYKDVFSSCNRAFTHDQHHMFWCGECPKCAFVFMILTPFIERSKLEQLWRGKNLLLDPSLETTYRQLLGIEGDKPLDCVGEVKEARAAMRLCQKQYPELAKYEFELPSDYDYRQWSEHAMPETIFTILKNKITP